MRSSSGKKNNYISAISIFILCLFIFSCSGSDSSVSGNGGSGEPPVNNSGIQTNKLSVKIAILSEPIGTSVNTTLFSGTEGNLLIDTGFDTAVEELSDSVNSINPMGVQLIVNTHIHYDHLGGNSLLSEGGKIIGHISGVDEYENSKPGANVFSVGKDSSFNFNGEEIRCLLPRGNGHSESDIMVYLPASKIICTGDLYISESFPSVSSARGATVQDHLTNLNYLINSFPNDVTYIPGHGKPSTHTELVEYYAMVQTTVDVVRTEMKSGRTLDQIMNDKVLEHWNQWGSYFENLTTDFWIRAIYFSYSYSD